MSWNGPELAPARDAELDLRGLAHLLRRALPLLRGVRRHLLLLAAAATLLLLVGLSSFLAFAPALWDGVFQGDHFSPLVARLLALDTSAGLTPELRRTAAGRLTWVLGGIAVAMTAAGMGVFYYGVWILQRLNQSLRMQLVDRLQALSLRFHEESRVGDAIYRTVQDSAMVTQLVQSFMLAPAFALLRFAVVSVMLFAFSPGLALALCAVWLPTALFGRALGQRMRGQFRVARATNSALTSQIQETLTGMRVVKAFGLERLEQERFEAASLTAFDGARTARSWAAGFGVGVFWLIGVVIIAGTALATLATVAGAPLWLAEQVDRLSVPRLQSLLIGAAFSVWTLGQYNAWKGLYSNGSDGISDVFRIWVNAQDIAVGLDRAFELLEREPEIADAPDAVALAPLQRGIAFRDVSFAYRADRPALVGVELELPVGGVTALVGATGAGKSTVMALLLRLFDPDAGAITWDGIDLRKLRVAELRAAIAIALQENVLFASSIGENIRYGRPGASEAQVREAARVACADDFIARLPRGYDTVLGERGAGLSTGQRQRLTLARALLKDPQVLLLDEPTAALDAETEQRLVENLAEWGRGRCILLVTHRLSTVRLARRVVVLDRGKVIEAGAPDELLTRPAGSFRALAELELAGAAS
ncbi:MAG TPA: ABC transporter ATP-binding protein [Myxococcota bacterium]|nr:ABC transporter ATP-binding protein [Myxococcota bacterium]